MSASMKSLAARQRILGALSDGPKSCREIADTLRMEVFETWADEHGYEIEWYSDTEPVGARLLAIHSATDRGLIHLSAHEVYPHLRTLERQGAVSRIQIPGHRPMLWQVSGATEGEPRA